MLKAVDRLVNVFNCLVNVKDEERLDDMIPYQMSLDVSVFHE